MKQPVRLKFENWEFIRFSQKVGTSRTVSGYMNKLNIPRTTWLIMEVLSLPRTLAIICKIGLTCSSKVSRGNWVGSVDKICIDGIR